MTKARLPIAIAILIAVFSVAPALGQDCTVLDVLPGEHIVLQASPNQPANYTYNWVEGGSWTFTENSNPVQRSGGIIDTPTLTFDAPTATGNYGLTLYVTSKSAGTCTDTECYTIHVVDAGCPTYGTYCITDIPLPTWSWTGIRHTSYNYAWTVNGASVGSNSYQYTPTAWATPFNVPTDSAPIKTSTLVLTITQTPTGHTTPITLITCTAPNAVTLVFKPDAAITSNVAVSP
ncbi:MAG: hypothetical protein WAW52_08555 [Methanothrix sp.]